MPFPEIFQSETCWPQLKTMSCSWATSTCLGSLPAKCISCNCTNKMGILGVECSVSPISKEGHWARCSRCFSWLLGMKGLGETSLPLRGSSPANCGVGQRKKSGNLHQCCWRILGSEKGGIKELGLRGASNFGICLKQLTLLIPSKEESSKKWFVLLQPAWSRTPYVPEERETLQL